MPKVIFEFETQEDMDRWTGLYHDGGGDNEMYEGFEQNGWEYPEIKITEEK